MSDPHRSRPGTEPEPSPVPPGNPRPTRQLVETGVVAILRASSAGRFPAVAETLADAGVTCMEFTLNTPGCLEALTMARNRLPESVALGVGTALTLGQVRRAVAAGAQFVVAPNVDPDVVGCATDLGVPAYPGALTPTEVVTAWRAGAAAVKIFPASLGGPGLLRQLRGPLPDVPLLPTGGIGIDDIAGYLRAGALGVGLGGPLLGDAADGGDLAALAERARRALRAVAEGRGDRND